MLKINCGHGLQAKPFWHKLGLEGDSPDTENSVVTVAELGNHCPLQSQAWLLETKRAYQDYIDNNPNLFASPATAVEVQAMVDAVQCSHSVCICFSTDWIGRRQP